VRKALVLLTLLSSCAFADEFESCRRYGLTFQARTGLLHSVEGAGIVASPSRIEDGLKEFTRWIDIVRSRPVKLPGVTARLVFTEHDARLIFSENKTTDLLMCHLRISKPTL
jgi:hypothetical protein